MGDAIEDTFVLPSGEGWKSKTEKKDSNLTMTFERTLAAGVPLKGDVSIKGEGDKVTLVNEAVVTRVGPRRFEYKETLRWTGPPPKGLQLKAEDLHELKAVLPAALATDENARGVADKMVELAMPMIFGPGDPLLAIELMHPDLAARRASQRVGAALLKALEAQFGDKMTPAQRREVALKMIETSFARTKPVAPDASAGPPTSDKASGLTPLMFIVKSPGKIVSSNGEVDELTGEVYWALYPPAAALKPVVLTAVVEVEQ